MAVNRIEGLFPGVHLIEGEVDGRTLRLPVLLGAEGALLIDAGSRRIAKEMVLPALEEIAGGPERLRWVVTTHCDLEHSGGNGVLKEAAPRSVLACGTPDRELVEDPEKVLSERYDPFRADHGVAYSDERLERMR